MEDQRQTAPASAAGAPGEDAQELRVLNAIAEGLNRAPDVRQALERTLELLGELLGLDTGWVWLLDRDTGQYYSAAARNLPPYLQEPVRMTGATCWCLSAYRKGKLTPSTIRLMDCSRLCAAVEANEGEATLGLCCHASLPLYFQERPLGVLNVAGPAWRQLTPEELRLLATVAYQVGIAVERARLAEEAARLARLEERARLAREIHDTLAQGLTAIALHLESGLEAVERNAGLARSRLERALELTRENLEEARRSVTDLRAAPLAGKTLPEALAALARRCTSESGVRVRLRLGDLPRLPHRIEDQLYRIAQEALTNVCKHAHAAEASIDLEQDAGTIRLRVRDNGVGIAFVHQRSVGHGLRSMRERAGLLGGRLRIGGGAGTLVTAVIPLDGEQPE